MDIISALKQSGLVGLGGASFPTWKKWESVKNSEERKKFFVCNLSEGEPGVFKDEYILQNHTIELVLGILLAAETVGATRSYIFINDKYKKYIKKLKRLIRGKKIEIFINTGRYLCGEETTLLQVIEGKERQPRQKPPYPGDCGLYGYPTLINNAETLYRAYLISQGNTDLKRFYSVSNDSGSRKIIEEKLDAKISEVISDSIIKSANFFRIGGVSGRFYSKNNMDQIVDGTGAIEIFSKKKTIFQALAESLVFLLNESCGKCTPCREGLYRVVEAMNELSNSENFWEHDEIIQTILDISSSAKSSSFCALGRSISNPIESAIELLREKK
ncbi:MAG: NADH-ubiquinone oxidoreductase-F iron-sulfur binding region domain-containing protein [Patescibacteria group bacterium]